MNDEKRKQEKLESMVADIISITVVKNYLPYEAVANYFYHSVTYQLLRQGILDIDYHNKDRIMNLWKLEWKMDAYFKEKIPSSDNKMIENTRIEIKNSLKKTALLERIPIEEVYDTFLQEIASRQKKVKRKIKEWNVEN